MDRRYHDHKTAPLFYELRRERAKRGKTAWVRLRHWAIEEAAVLVGVERPVSVLRKASIDFQPASFLSVVCLPLYVPAERYGVKVSQIEGPHRLSFKYKLSGI